MSQLVENLCGRLAAKEPVAVVGGNTKSFLGGQLLDEPVSMLEHSGIQRSIDAPYENVCPGANNMKNWWDNGM